jgi:hypothetical protein
MQPVNHVFPGRKTHYPPRHEYDALWINIEELSHWSEVAGDLIESLTRRIEALEQKEDRSNER